jgi:hypothetical protein
MALLYSDYYELEKNAMRELKWSDTQIIQFTLDIYDQLLADVREQDEREQAEEKRKGVKKREQKTNTTANPRGVSIG